MLSYEEMRYIWLHYNEELLNSLPAAFTFIFLDYEKVDKENDTSLSDLQTIDIFLFAHFVVDCCFHNEKAFCGFS